jgi:hypothetical protein
MDTGREQAIKAKRAEYADAVTAKVNALPNLSETQRARVLRTTQASLLTLAQSFRKENAPGDQSRQTNQRSNTNEHD